MQKIYSAGANDKNDFYGLRQVNKLLFTMRNIKINSKLEPFSAPAAEAPVLNISSHGTFSNDHEDHPNQHENSHKLCQDSHSFLITLF